MLSIASVTEGKSANVRRPFGKWDMVGPSLCRVMCFRPPRLRTGKDGQGDFKGGDVSCPEGCEWGAPERCRSCLDAILQEHRFNVTAPYYQPAAKA